MKKEALFIAFMATAAAPQAQAKQIDVVDTWSLNIPTMECFRSFSEHHHKSTGWIYYNAHINCVTLKAFIHYDHRIHVSDTA